VRRRRRSSGKEAAASRNPSIASIATRDARAASRGEQRAPCPRTVRTARPRSKCETSSSTISAPWAKSPRWRKRFRPRRTPGVRQPGYDRSERSSCRCERVLRVLAPDARRDTIAGHQRPERRGHEGARVASEARSAQSTQRRLRVCPSQRRQTRPELARRNEKKRFNSQFAGDHHRSAWPAICTSTSVAPASD